MSEQVSSLTLQLEQQRIHEREAIQKLQKDLDQQAMYESVSYQEDLASLRDQTAIMQEVIHKSERKLDE